MQRRYWDVSSYIGKSAKIKAIDFETGGWGHLNFDDIKFVK